jgi:arsenite methyltransferase
MTGRVTFTNGIPSGTIDHANNHKGPNMSESIHLDDKEAVRKSVRTGYAAVAQGDGACCGPAKTCCGGESEALAQKLGYNEAELASLPDGANMGLSCGNPTALAALKPGEVVVDLGSGGGFDVFLAGQNVGASGRSIGVDMTPEMLEKARRNTASYRERTQLDNVEFRLGEIEHLPLADQSADVIISNCVVNLSPEKDQVWREMFRVLKPGGRVAVSDVALLKPLPQSIMEQAAAYTRCLAGAVLVEETERMATQAGFTNLNFKQKPGYIETMMSMNDPLYTEVLSQLPEDIKVAEHVTSLEISARKPDGACCCG